MSDVSVANRKGRGGAGGRLRGDAAAVRAPRSTDARLLAAMLLLAAAVLHLTLAPAAAAQDPEEDPNGARLRGVVVDAVSGRPIGNALVVHDDEERATLTDAEGRFDLARVESGQQSLTVRSYGYELLGVLVMAAPGTTVDVQVPLTPVAVLIDGVTVVADRLELMDQRLRSRRRSVAMSTQAFEQERLIRSASSDMLEFVQREASLFITPCDARSWSSTCVFRRGRTVEPRVFIDEAPLTGGLDFLASYRPHELYLVEVYSRGLEIRAYTHQFMERMAVRPVSLIPINLWPR